MTVSCRFRIDFFVAQLENMKTQQADLSVADIDRDLACELDHRSFWETHDA